MKILIVAPNYLPEVAGPRVPELAQRFVRMGHEVTVLTGFPNYPTGIIPPEYRPRWRRGFYRETINGVTVMRTWMVPAPNRRPLERILNYTSFFISACITGLFLPRPDIIIGTTPQLLAGLAARWLATIKRVPFVFEVRDLWPDSLVASGVGGNSSLMIRAIAALAAFLYKTADHVVAVTPASRQELITRWGVPAEKVTVVPNGVETDLFSPDASADGIAARFHLADRFWVTYTGTIGLAHGLETVLRSAEILKSRCPEVGLLLIGAGADRERLVEMARERAIDNVVFISEQPRDQMPAFIKMSGACLVLLKKAPIFKTVIPSKMLEFMSCGKPIILGVDGYARQMLDEAGAGVFIEPENPQALADAVMTLYGQDENRRAMGERARAFIVNRYSRPETARAYIALLSRFVPARGGAA